MGARMRLTCWRKHRGPVLAVCVLISLIGTAVVAGGGGLNAGGTRAFGAAASSRLVLSEDRASAARDAVEPAVSPSAWLTLSGTAPARLTISPASVTATGSSRPALTFAPRDSAPASAVTGPGPAWISPPRVGETALAAVPGTLPATPSVPTSLRADQSTIVGVPLPRDDGGSPLAHSSLLSTAPAAPDEQAREVDLARPLTPPVSTVIGCAVSAERHAAGPLFGERARRSVACAASSVSQCVRWTAA